MKNKKTTDKTTVKVEETAVASDKGRKEDDYFFPDKRVTVKASSLKEAKQKIE